MNLQLIRQNIWTVIILLAILTSLIIEQPYFHFHIRLVAIGIAIILATTYKYNWLDFAKAIFGIVITYGSFAFGFIIYMLLPNESVERSIINHEPPPQRFDIFIFGTLFGLFSALIALLHYYKFKETETTILEKYFSYVLVIGLTIITVISFFINF